MAAAGPELCPHCRRPFKRLRAHLPHCKAAPPAPPASPRPGPGSASRPAASAGPGGERAAGAPLSPAGAPGWSPQPSAATGSGPEPGPAPEPGPRPAPGRVPRAVRAVARSLDLHPEEVEDVPKKLQQGVKVVIEKHRARVVRDKEPRSRGEGTEPGPAPRPQRRKTAPKPKSEEPRSQGAAGSGTASSKAEKSSLKAAKVLQEPAESRTSPGGLVQREGRDESRAGGERGLLEFGVRSEPPVCAEHPGILQLSLAEMLAGHGQGTPRKELPRARGEPGQAVPGLGRAPELALLPPAQTQPPGSSGRAAGLEWFADLDPEAEGLRGFPGKLFHQDGRSTVETARGGLARGQQGPLSERPLLEVRLGELHTWISTCSFSPQGLLGAVQRACSSYCAKYIHVKQGGSAGISMLLAGYCLLSYGWNYQHFKRHRWRKYH